MLDVRARDQAGNWFNIEMQVYLFDGLLQRLVYYACSLYLDQLGAGDNYASLRPAISICLLSKNVFRETLQQHHRFVLTDAFGGKRLERGIEIHTLELLKYNLEEQSISSAGKMDQWVFLLLRAQNYDAKKLRELLPSIEFQSAISAIEVISSKTEDRIMYDQREKAQRDYEWAISGAKAEGLEQGLERGELRGKVHLLESLLGEPESPNSELDVRPLAELEQLVAQLQSRLRGRDS